MSQLSKLTPSASFPTVWKSLKDWATAKIFSLNYVTSDFPLTIAISLCPCSATIIKFGHGVFLGPFWYCWAGMEKRTVPWQRLINEWGKSYTWLYIISVDDFYKHSIFRCQVPKAKGSIISAPFQLLHFDSNLSPSDTWWIYKIAWEMTRVWAVAFYKDLRSM